MDDVRNVPNEWKQDDIVWVPIRKAEDVISLLRQGVVENMSLDHDMGQCETTGYELLCWMEMNNVWPSGQIWVHSANPVGCQSMAQVIKKWKNQTRKENKP